MCTAHGCAPCFRLAAGALRRRLSCGKPYPISGLVATYPLADFKRPPNPSYLKDNRVGTPEHTRTGTSESRFCKVTDGRGCTVGGPSLGSGLLFPEVGPHHWLAVRRQATHLSALLSLTRLHAQGLAGAAGAGALCEAEWVPLASHAPSFLCQDTRARHSAWDGSSSQPGPLSARPPSASLQSHHAGCCLSMAEESTGGSKPTAGPSAGGVRWCQTRGPDTKGP